MDGVFIGTIILWAGSYVPVGWRLCNGDSLSIQQNPALFAVLSNTYGGNQSQGTFALPNLVGKFIQGTAIPQNVYQTGGAASVPVQPYVTLTADNLPAHEHPNSNINLTGLVATTQVKVSTIQNQGAAAPVQGAMLCSTTAGVASAASIYLPAATSLTNQVKLGGVKTEFTTPPSVAVGPAVTGNPVNSPEPVVFYGQAPTQPPSLDLCYIICVEGEFPMKPS
ncbi:tail Collar domain protein [Pseudomonas sp. StFLB209]|uniref:phage tail protein n=1 Tax=Pseudomonas sp. StFLB209 TaxID=1028989 RepID=UPI0004F6483E|nr:tail fiber protein [Pseudomonas sp. StFLB209]BAP40742.1 tail Collar domain protein [Pseudomonas sp. StFLB209]